jgi:hypothetical protein
MPYLSPANEIQAYRLWSVYGLDTHEIAVHLGRRDLEPAVYNSLARIRERMRSEIRRNLRVVA